MDDAAARAEFLAQAGELSDALAGDLQRLRRAGRTGRERRALLDQTFRHAHTLKGSAASHPDADEVARLAHALEDLFDSARAARAPLDEAALDACEDAAEALSQALAALARGARPAPLPPTLLDRLRSLARAAAPSAANASTRDDARSSTRDDDESNTREGVDARRTREDDERRDEAARLVGLLPADVAAQLNEAERRRLAEAASEGARVISVGAAFDLVTLEEEFRRLTDALEESCELLATLPGPPSDSHARINFRLVCATRLTAAELARRLAPLDAEVETLLDAPAPAAADGPPQSPSSARVPLSELDELAFVTDELFDDAMAALELARPHAPEIEEAAARLRRNFLALAERVLALRMQPLAPTLERAARAASAAARAAGKSVEIEIAGGEARLDRAAAERVAEPLVHLLRNAVDHGVETREERRAAGKPERGRVRLSAHAGGAGVRVKVEDDGRGIDIEGVSRAARAQGLVADGAQVSEAQALRLIFRPGFSTTARVTELSGRGVGLDAVEHEIERAGGEVRVRTRRGGGTCFELHLPLALALIPAVLLKSAAQTYALDAAHVVETGQLDPSAVKIVTPDATAAADTTDATDATKTTGMTGSTDTTGATDSTNTTGATDAAGTIGATGTFESAAFSRRVARWRGRTLPLVSLAELLGRAPAAAREDACSPVVVVRLSGEDADGGRGDAPRSEASEGGRQDVGREIVLEVDQVLGRRDALVRGLGRHAARWRGVAGAIDLRDGSVALMLDLPRLFETRKYER